MHVATKKERMEYDSWVIKSVMTSVYDIIGDIRAKLDKFIELTESDFYTKKTFIASVLLKNWLYAE